MESPRDESWHFRKEIQVGHLLTTLTVAISAVVYVQTIERRIAILELQLSVQSERDRSQDSRSAENQALIRRQLERVEEKLDAISDRIGNHTNGRRDGR